MTRLEMIVRKLAESDPVDENLVCTLCEVGERYSNKDLKSPRDHASLCPWKLAKEWVELQQTPSKSMAQKLREYGEI